MDLLQRIAETAVASLQGKYPVRRLPENEYSRMKWPALLPAMRFEVEEYALDGFGHLMVMHTRAMGAMQLITASFMPFECLSVPYLLIDAMCMKRRRTVFVEFYDCTAAGIDAAQLEQMAGRHQDVPDYAEKPAWYVSERMKGSLIKGGEEEKDERFAAMVQDALSVYAELCGSAKRDPENRRGLEAFRLRMLREGNPASSTMEKVLGKDGAKRFFCSTVMPLEKRPE